MVLTDKEDLMEYFKEILQKLNISVENFEFFSSPASNIKGLEEINIKKQYHELIGKYDMIFSLHCRQVFPAELVKAVKCVNLHPGFNPYNRGWYPHVFSIINGLPAGATLHEMNEQIDAGNIIAQKQITIKQTDTSLEVYNKVREAELQLLEENLLLLLKNQYTTTTPSEKGNYNSKKDYEELKQIDLNERLTMEQAIKRLKALTHEPFKNAYYINKQTGKKIYVTIKIESE